MPGAEACFWKHEKLDAMRILVAPIVIGFLALAGAVPAAAQSSPDKGTSVGAATADNSAAERNNFTNHAQDEMRMWEQKLHDFNAETTNASEAQTSVSKKSE